MGIIDGVVRALFKTSQDGKLLFFPWGALGRGYVLPDIKMKQEIEGFVKKFYILLFSAFLIYPIGKTAIGLITLNPHYGQFFVISVMVVIYFLLMGWYYIKIKSYTDGLEPTTEKLQIKESYQTHHLVLPIAGGSPQAWLP
jgi:hypothetical protein